jgi:hypothetical protein
LNVCPNDCVIGFGVPLTEAAFRRQEQGVTGGDFIRSQQLTWEKYRYFFADSSAKVLAQFRLWGVRLIEELTLQALRDLFSRPPTAMILFAHWSDTDRVELADGLVSSEDIVHLVPADFTGIIDLCVCHPRALVVGIKQKCPGCLVKYTDTNAAPLWWLYMYQAMFKILATRPDYFQALADAFTSLSEPRKV